MFHHLVPVSLVLQQLARHPALKPRDELEVEILRLHEEPRHSVSSIHVCHSRDFYLSNENNFLSYLVLLRPFLMLD